MTKDENISDPNSCWNRAAAKEPIFILCANDEIAPIVIKYWARLYLLEKTGQSIDINKLTDKQKEKYLNALMDAEDMIKWKISQRFV